jgi:SGNH domain (fused to AT3 domains)/Acyltransferase family
LLHCWSLSVEEQFYLVWPLFIVFAHRIGRPVVAIAVVSVASLAAASLATDSSAVFFLTPFRIYEFGCGALTIYLERVPFEGRLREALSGSGILAIIASAIVFRPDMANLGPAMLVPCLGAAAVIVGGTGTAGARLLGQPVALGLGAISYSVYLCHWPIVFFAEFIFGGAADGVTGTALMLLTILVVGSLMYLFVERPFIRSPKYRDANYRRTLAAFSLVVLPLAAFTHFTFISHGFEWRIRGGQGELARLQTMPFGQGTPVDGPVAFQLVGDSHAGQYDAGLSLIRSRLGVNMEVLAGSHCPILYGVSLRTYRERQTCSDIRDRSLAKMSESSLPIIFVESWALYDDAEIEFDGATDRRESKGSYTQLEQALDATMRRFASVGKHILLFGAQVNADCAFNRSRLLQGPLPHAPLPPCPPGTREAAERFGKPFNDMLARIQARWPANIELLRPVDYFCDEECPTMDRGLWLYFDQTHFTVAGSYFMVRRIEQPLVNFIRSAKSTRL